MWTQYRKTFWPIQIAVVMVTLAVYFGMNHLLARAIIFFIIMQVAAVVGAAWAARLKSAILSHSTRLPLQKRA